MIATSKVHIQKQHGSIRHARIEGLSETIVFGSHGALKAHYKVAAEEPDHATVLDHMIAAVGGCLNGTLTGALEVRQIPAPPEKLETLVEGDIDVVDGVLRITKIRVHHKIRIPAGKREPAERAVSSHPKKCPAAVSIQGAIALEVTAEITEE